MTRRDEELLAKQMRGMAAPHNEGFVGLAVLTVFVAGLALGALLVAPHNARAPLHNEMAAVSLGTPATVQR